MKNVDLIIYYLSLLIFFIMAIYRLAILITIDTGPLGIFENIRSYIHDKSFEYNQKFGSYRDFNKFKKYDWLRYYIFNNLDEGINCTNCTGVWSAFLLVPFLMLAMKYRIFSFLILALGGSGFQYWLEHRS